MAWNPSPEVALVRDAANKLGAFMAVVVYLTPDAKIGYVSYGQNKALCGEAKKLGDTLVDAAKKHFE